MDEQRIPDETPDRPGRGAKPSPGNPPPAGPHADPTLTTPDATPGAGALPPPGEREDGDSTSG